MLLADDNGLDDDQFDNYIVAKRTLDKKPSNDRDLATVVNQATDEYRTYLTNHVNI